LLAIARLQALPCYDEILRRLTMGQSVRSLSLWLTQQRFEGPCGQWSFNYWRKLLSPLDRDVRVARGRTASAERRRSRHPEPPAPEKVQEVLAEIVDPKMQLANILPEATRQVWKHVGETADEITAGHILKFAFLQQVRRVDNLMALEKNLNIALPNGHKEMDCLRRIAEALLKLEGLRAPRVEPLDCPPVSVSEVSRQMRRLNDVDRNLVRTAIMKVINMVQEETNGQFETRGLDAHAGAETATDEPGNSGTGSEDVPGSA
jgi:hypothetical protein